MDYLPAISIVSSGTFSVPPRLRSIINILCVVARSSFSRYERGACFRKTLNLFSSPFGGDWDLVFLLLPEPLTEWVSPVSSFALHWDAAMTALSVFGDGDLCSNGAFWSSIESKDDCGWDWCSSSLLFRTAGFDTVLVDSLRNFIVAATEWASLWNPVEYTMEVKGLFTSFRTEEGKWDYLQRTKYHSDEWDMQTLRKAVMVTWEIRLMIGRYTSKYLGPWTFRAALYFHFVASSHTLQNERFRKLIRR